jgi:hypothetical protein
MGEERRGRSTFWIDDRIIDQYGPLLEEYPFGADALAVYAVLARRAGRDGKSWERVKPMARLAATKERSFQRCIRLLELLGLVAVESCYYEGTKIRTSNRYILLPPPLVPPRVDADPARWPAPTRPVIYVSKGANRRHVADARPEARREGEKSSRTGPLNDAAAWSALLASSPAGRRADTSPGVVLTPPSRQEDTTPGVALTPQEGNTREGNTRKEERSQRNDDKNHDDGTQTPHDSRPMTHDSRLTTPDSPSFVIAEIGLSNRQVWAAALGELARRGTVERAELEHWLRPATLVGRAGDGDPASAGITLLLGAPTAVARERIATRLLPAVRDALSTTIGVPVSVEVVGEW